MANDSVALLNERLAATLGIDAKLSAFLRLPAAVVWNRLEGRPRSDDLTRPLRAEVRDPAWMLARQWQFGEFEAEDAGTPIQAKLAVLTLPLAEGRFGPAGAPEPFDDRVPLEASVERQPVEPDLMLGVSIGRRWLRLLASEFGPDDAVLASFQTRYRVSVPAPNARDLAALKINSTPAELLLRRALAQRTLDGKALLGAIRRAAELGVTASALFEEDGVAVAPGRAAVLDTLASDLLSWFEGLFGSPGRTAWVAPRLEYDISVSAQDSKGEVRLAADEFPGGHLDWYSFDRVEAPAGVGAELSASSTVVKSFVPTPVTFFGAPAVRYWEFEDSRVGFGLTSASKTDLAKILLAEFGLVFSNDWFIVPFRASVGSLLDVKGIVVTDNFGFNTLIEPVAKRHRELGLVGNWSMWTLALRNEPGQIDSRLFLAPVLEAALESDAVDEVLFLRDEMANLVWGVETVIPSELGGGRDARLAAHQLQSAILQAVAPPPVPVEDPMADVQLRYQLMGSVPENWIPFVAVTLTDERVATNLLQGAMPRDPPIEPGRDADGAPVLENNVTLPRGAILARDPVTHPNLIREEEIQRDGIVVRRTFRRARWVDGTTHTWFRLTKQVGRGEGSSGLSFDSVIEKEAEKAEPMRRR